MSNTELTPWFVNGEKPARPGVYNVSCRKFDQTGYWFAKWDGNSWFVAKELVQLAEREGNKLGEGDDRHWHVRGSWRGLAQNPAGLRP